MTKLRVEPHDSPDNSVPFPPSDAVRFVAWTDEQLWRDYVEARRPEVFTQITHRHGALVYRVCLRLTANVHDAEDATQAVFFLLARHPEKVRASLAGWLHQMARNVALHLIRDRTRRARREEAAAAMRKPDSSAAASVDLREELDAAIAALPLRLREPVLLCHVEGRCQEEAAQILGCNQGTLSRRATDGLTQLRRLLARRGVAVGSTALVAFLAEQNATGLPTALSQALAAGSVGTGNAAACLANAATQALLWGKISTALFGCFAVAATAAAVVVGTLALPSPASVPLSDLPFEAVANGWGPVEQDRSNGEMAPDDGNGLSLHGRSYARGLGVHAYSEIYVPLDREYTRFLADIGLDDEVRAGILRSGMPASVVFQVWADGVKLFDSGTMLIDSPPQTVDVDVSGKQALTLIVLDAGDGDTFDHANWADARLVPSRLSLRR